MMKAVAFLGLASLFTLGTGFCDAAGPAPSVNASNPLAQYARAGLSAEEFVAAALKPFDEEAGKAGVLTARDMRHRQSLEAAAQRASAIGLLLRYDLNADLRVTAEEIANAQSNAAPPSRAPRKKKAAGNSRLTEGERIMQRFDLDHDGAIEMAEIVQAGIPEDRTSRSNPLPALLDSELGKDGKLTRKELTLFAKRTFTAVDADKDGQISIEEYQALAGSSETQLASLR